MAEKKKRIRKVRSVTLDNEVVGKLKAVGKALSPKEENLSRLLDMAAAEFVKKRGAK